MNKQDLLLEIGLEEMPARFVTGSIEQLTSKIEKWLKEKKISFDSITHFSTPRRLAVIAYGVSTSQEDVEEEAKGPAKKIAIDHEGNWSKAAVGFTKGQGMSVEDIYFKEINGVEYAHVRKFTKGQATKEILPEIVHIITGLTFPKNMRWANETLKYIRPIKWLLAIYGTEIIPFSITNVSTSNRTNGHRFLGKEIEIGTPEEYVTKLLGEFVIANAEERKNAILSQISKLEEEQGWTIPVDEELLEEVTNLVEYPTALYGRFEEEFLELPEEVLITSMKEHQRYFPVKKKDGTLLPFFVTVRNGDHMHLETVAKGNEKVLRARLSDAAFFYREDQKMNISDALAKLGSIVYHEEIGTLSEKVARVRSLTNQLAELLTFNEEDKKTADRAAEISKFDLVTHMVYEFPELQGFMGEKYARQKGESEAVAVAINEHYMPRNAEDSTPNSNSGAILAVAEKLDTIVSFFAIGNIPSGSQDPYALRRQASGIVQILINKEWNVSLTDLLRLSILSIKEKGIGEKDEEELLLELIGFFKLRLKHYLQEQSIRYDIIDAVLEKNITALPTLVKKAVVLQTKKDGSGFKETVEALSRVLTISNKAVENEEINESLFENEFETTLYNQYRDVKAALESNEASEEEFFDKLAFLQGAINDFFDHTMVMAENQALKNNRLALMSQLAELIVSFANVKEIVTK
ncbi:glycine--tRNA ligase subunit beta [Robertmurraya korlensis]|uniref:glycine--tRNA ligase subunit beta n=1 Tax=Robertmurraya korlensis TaxID=519977 RepID=UPI00203A80BF|nr:glycine--tRNA ligase subunit beta [Robertmurraya korlensis]MCM3599542.1 glycine--tRNA ligase subunit beta [Robertmurraya korlensis]